VVERHEIECSPRQAIAAVSQALRI
jgi:hypothetical protein